MAGKGAKVKATGFVQNTAVPQARDLLRWYDHHRRAMPWRALQGQKPDPYRVWLSEIMLQQTTVATVGPYFNKFIQRWPVLADLAQASLDDVLRMWAGLGYYRRARMLHQCAVILQRDYGGIFPQSEKEFLTLPGFGPYTAAAVRAIAFDQPANVVDGNVERVMARIFAITEPMPAAKKPMRAVAARLVPAKRAGDYAQALMDLGATVCTPRSPKCEACPWQNHCQARAQGIAETLPRRIKSQAKPIRRAVAFVLFDRQGRVFLQSRPTTGLLAGMREVPSSPWLEQPMPTLKKTLRYAPAPSEWRILSEPVRHVFSHFGFEVTVAVNAKPLKVSDIKRLKSVGVWVALTDLKHEALPSVMKKIVMAAVKEV